MDLSLYTNFANNIAQQETQINTLQQQISTGVSVQTPDQNPAAFETATIGNDQISAMTSDTATQADIQSQLGSVSNTYGSVTSLLNNLQSVMIQALNGTTSADNMKSLATQVSAAGQELLGFANSTGPEGTYLFAGSRGTLQPFQTNGSGNVVYVGDGGQSLANVAPNTTVASIANGEVFMTGGGGDGYSSVTANQNNKGTGVLISQGVVNQAKAAAFQSSASAPPGGPITLTFHGAPPNLTYTATQGSAAVPIGSGSGSAKSGKTLQLKGMDFELNGTPGSGDTFTISPSRPQSMFSLVQSIYTTMSQAGTSAAQVAQTNQALNNDLSALQGYQQSVAMAQAQNGVTLQAVSNAGTSNASQQTSLQTAVQSAVGVNMPTAISTLDETMTALQAAMAAFGGVQKLSLFNYL